MKSVLPIFRLFAVAVCVVAAPAGAAPFTAFWDRAAFGSLPAGYGVSETTANNARVAGLPFVQPPGQPLSDAPDIQHALDPSSLLIGGPATITSNWSVFNDTGSTLENLYAVFVRPVPATIILNGQSQGVTYDPSDVGLTLGSNWVIMQVVGGSNTVYYPAVSLGTLANGAAAAFPLFHVLDNPQVFSESFNYELGMPKWTVTFTAVPVPEAASGVLVLFGLLAIAVGRRKRS